MRTVLDVGNCTYDFNQIRSLLSQFQVRVLRASHFEDALEVLRGEKISLILVNRLLDADNSRGTDLIKLMKSDPALACIPVMLVSNFPQSQAEAISFGAEKGFGKDDLLTGKAAEAVTPFLSNAAMPS